MTTTLDRPRDPCNIVFVGSSCACLLLLRLPPPANAGGGFLLPGVTA